jgi:hypothetical protein
MSYTTNRIYSDLQVSKTFEMVDIADVRNTVDEMIHIYESLSQDGKFSVRVLLPRGDRLTYRAKKIGLTIQGEFLLALKKKRLKPHLIEIRYIHDQNHYGWLLLNPEIYDSEFRRLQVKQDQ